jgi:hypothetical protein
MAQVAGGARVALGVLAVAALGVAAVAGWWGGSAEAPAAALARPLTASGGPGAPSEPPPEHPPGPGGRVTGFDKARLARAAREGGGYLRRVSDAGGGVHKFYHLDADALEPRVHTVYTASTVLTLLKLQAWSKEAALAPAIARSAGFLLRMQSTAADATRGGFFYSLDLERGEHDCKVRVGTTSKAVFTLLELHRQQPGERRYLEAATRAGDFLLRMQRPDGSVTSALSCAEARAGRPPGERRESLLYTGQVLSALSRLHRATAEPRFLDGAARTALHLQQRVGQQGCYVGDAYRRPNPVSSSWIVMSLLDFARATRDGAAEALAFRCGESLARMQRRDPKAPADYGRWRGSLSSSGAGWLAEVMSELYLQCRGRPEVAGCEGYRDAATAAFRLLLEHTVDPEAPAAAGVRNPEAAAGGILWSRAERYVRTDSVCHGLNAYLNLLPHLPDEGALLALEDAPAPPAPPPGEGGEAEDTDPDE